MTPTVVVPVDEVAGDERALPVAIALATAAGGRVDLLTAAGPHAYLDQLDAHQRRVRDGLPEAVQGDCRIEVDDLPVADHLVRAAGDDGAVLCMAATGRGSVGELLAGSVAADVVRRAPRPVVLVGPAATGAEGLLTGPVVAGLDGSERDAGVVDAAAWLAQLTGATVRAVHVVAHRPDPDAIAASERILDRARATLAARGAEVELVERRGPDPAPLLLEEVDATSVLVTGAHRRGHLGRSAFAATAMWLVHRCPCPLVVVPSGPLGELPGSPGAEEGAEAPR